MEPRLRTELWVKALIRRCDLASVPALVVRRGEAQGGVVLVKVNHLDGTACVYSQVRHAEGHRVWLGYGTDAKRDEASIDAYIERQVSRDPDLWVLEIEDKEGRHFLDGPVE